MPVTNSIHPLLPEGLLKPYLESGYGQRLSWSQRPEALVCEVWTTLLCKSGLMPANGKDVGRTAADVRVRTGRSPRGLKADGLRVGLENERSWNQEPP